MSARYSNLLSPVKAGNLLLKNHIAYANSLPHFLQGPEPYPADPVMKHYGDMARNGAGIVTVGTRHARNNKGEDGQRIALFNIADKSVENYLSLLAETIHFYGAKAAIAYMHYSNPEYDVSDIPEIEVDKHGKPLNGLPLMIKYRGPRRQITLEEMDELKQFMVNHARYYQDKGFDMISIHMSYETTIFAHFLSNKYNHRTDEYGGCLENRARYPLEICQAIKDACGKDFLVEIQISGEEYGADGFTTDDLVKFAHLAEGKVDILQLRAPNGDMAHPTGFNSVRHLPSTLRYAELIKKSGAKVLAAPCGGFQDLNDCESYIRDGKADLLYMARALFCDPEYGKKAYEGRGEDVVPCIRCNKCHGTSMDKGPWISVCSINPKLSFGHRIEWMVKEPDSVKRVAVIGGGPAGMNAAITAAQRGHKVTLYEKNDFLGGQLRHSDFAPFKWPIKDYKDFLADRLEKEGVKVILGTKATPQMIREGGYDVALLALGAEANKPDIPGIDGENVWTAPDVYGRDKELGENVVVIGGAEIGTETGMYLAQMGHKVTVLTRQSKLAPDMERVHYYDIVRKAWEHLSNFSFITKATTKAIGENSVTYMDAEGKDVTIPADSIVIAGGMNPLHDDALSFNGSADATFVIGDCNKVGSIQKAVVSAYAIASTL